MKHKASIIWSVTIGMLILLVIILLLPKPLLDWLGIKPVCIEGNFPQFKIVSCPQFSDTAIAVTPIPLLTLEGKTPIPLIFDDDGSPDGMIALLFFLRHPLYKVEAITISPGEAHPEVFAQHITRVLAIVGRSDIPVGIGRATPLQGNNAFPEPWRQSSDTFWDISLPQATPSLAPRPAAELMVEILSKSLQPVAIFISGTHTNLAESLRLDPDIRDHIRSIHIMGGSINTPGNIESDWQEIHNRVAEWNIWVDPLAASEVFDSGLPLYLMPLDGTNQVIWSISDAQSWSASGTTEGELASKILTRRLQSWSVDRTYIWDLAAAVATTDSRLCPAVPLALDINVEPGSEQGRTVVIDQPANALVCLEPDAEQVKARAADILTR